MWIGVKRDLLLVCTLVLGVKRDWLLHLWWNKTFRQRPPQFVFGYILYVFLLIPLACAKTQSFPVSLACKNYFVGKAGNSWRRFLKNNIYMYKFMTCWHQRQNLFISKYSVSEVMYSQQNLSTSTLKSIIFPQTFFCVYWWYISGETHCATSKPRPVVHKSRLLQPRPSS